MQWAGRGSRQESRTHGWGSETFLAALVATANHAGPQQRAAVVARATAHPRRNPCLCTRALVSRPISAAHHPLPLNIFSSQHSSIVPRPGRHSLCCHFCLRAPSPPRALLEGGRCSPPHSAPSACVADVHLPVLLAGACRVNVP